MCYYRAVKLKNDVLLNLNGIEHHLDGFDMDVAVADGFAYGLTPVIVAQPADWKVEMMEWGFLPPYLRNREAVEKWRRGYTDQHGKYHVPMTTLNAIGEELLLPNKMYRDAALHRRCLLLASGFYEWRHIHPIGKKGLPLKTAVKYPYHITTKDPRGVLLMAGVWQQWTDKDTGETVPACALVTTAANSLMTQIHNSKKRMPVILPPQLAGDWISEGIDEERVAELAVYQYPAQQMEAWPIAKDFKTALEPAAPCVYDQLPALDV